MADKFLKFSRKQEILLWGAIASLVAGAVYENQSIQASHSVYFQKPLTDEETKLYSNYAGNAVVIYPIFTQFAYKPDCFYPPVGGTYPFHIVCNMLPQGINDSYVEGQNSYELLQQLDYHFVDDIMVDKHPEILKDYDAVILLHNEYVTDTEFNAIVSHKNVLYLYPNSLYAKVAVNYNTMTMTLINGHGYPSSSIKNGFGYVTDSQYEYDLNCNGYKWIKMPNGIQPTCWPEMLIKSSDRTIPQILKDFPNKLPPTISINKTYDMSNFGYCDYYGKCTPKPTT